MRSETIAIHGGYDVDPTTRAVAVPIYQTVAYAFDSADHGAALFNLEVEGFRYSRISNPTTEVLERRVAALEGGREALCVSTGQAALNYAALNVRSDVDPTTRAVAVPIYQTVAYAFDSADHGAALFNLEVEGFRYSRISNPTTEVLERRVAALEGGREALCVSTGQAALNYAALNVSELGSNIVSVPQLYGTTYTLFAHVLPSQGVTV